MMNRSAEFSPDRLYRRRLDRWWGTGPRVGWLMCNPSTAGEEDDDPTIRKVTGFSARWGFQGFTVINVFDLVLTDSSQLHKAQYPVTPRNGEIIAAVCKDIELLIVAWGCESVMKRMTKRGMDPLFTVKAIQAANDWLPVECLGFSKSGNPYHPLMLAYDTPRVAFECGSDVRVSNLQQERSLA
jgi:hypothetical protein